MTSILTQPRYKSYQEYLDDDSLSPDRNYRLLNTGELIEVASEDDLNLRIAAVVIYLIAQLGDRALSERVRSNSKEIQVSPVGDGCVNRKPDLMILHPDHLTEARQAVLIGMEPPAFVAEVVSPGNEKSDNYLRDYQWKRQQYQSWGISEYWIIDPHRQKVTVLLLKEGVYVAQVYEGNTPIPCATLPALSTTAAEILTEG